MPANPAPACPADVADPCQSISRELLDLAASLAVLRSRVDTLEASH